MNNFKHEIAGRHGVRAATLVMALVLAACGGGGGNPGTVGGGTGTGGGNTGGGTGGSTTVAKTTLVVLDGNGTPTTSIAGGQTAKINATVTLASGKPAVGALVTFTAGAAGMVVFGPNQESGTPSGSATTNEAGIATIQVRSANPTVTTALAINVTSVDLEKQTSTATVNLSLGASPLTVGTLSFAPAPTAPVPAFNTLALSIPLTNGNQPASTAPGLSMTSLCVGDGTATLVPGALANGILLATYTNNGCTRGTDTLTVSAGTSSQTISVPVAAANIGSIQFIGSNLSGSSIVLKGSGGQGRSESAQLTFRVVDNHNNGLSGVDVDFQATTYTGGLTVTPVRATTDANGNVNTMVSSGTIPTPVRVTASATRNNLPVSGLSDALTVSTGLPIQKAMSMSADRYNLEGGEYDGVTASITVRLADQYGNPVSDGTAINFVTEGGAVGSAAQGACTTSGGGCTVSLISQNFRPLNGRVTVLAYAQGIEDFVDTNGDGQYTCSNYVDPVTGKVPTTYRPLVDTCLSGGEPFSDMEDPFLDTGYHGSLFGKSGASTFDKKYESDKGDLPFPYAHASYAEKGDGKWGLNYIRSSLEMVFSNSTVTMIRQVCSGDTCRDWSDADGDPAKIAGVAGPGCSAQPLAVRLIDSNNNPLPADTTVSAVDASKLSPGTFAPGRVPSTTVIGGTIHKVTVKPEDGCAAGSFTLQIATPKGKVTAFPFSSK